MGDVKFGWLSPVAGHAGSDFVPIVMYQQAHILPTVAPLFDSVWVADHFYGFDAQRTEGFLEAWTTLTWLAARFPDLMVSHHVLGGAYRNPALLAKMASTLQVLSGGRLIVGIGAGIREEEHLSYGYEFPKPSIRLGKLEETVQICKLMWTEPHPTFAGKYFRIDDAAATPRPEVIPPICIGSSGEKFGLPIVGRHADMWNGRYRGDEPGWIRRRDIVHEEAARAGRDPAEIILNVTCAGDLPQSDQDSAQWLERLTHLTDLGVSYFVLDFGHPLSPEPAIRFAEQVIAPIRGM